MFTKVRHWTTCLGPDKPDHILITTSVRSPLIISFHLCLGLPNVLPPSQLPRSFVLLTVRWPNTKGMFRLNTQFVRSLGTGKQRNSTTETSANTWSTFIFSIRLWYVRGTPSPTMHTVALDWDWSDVTGQRAPVLASRLSVSASTTLGYIAKGSPGRVRTVKQIVLLQMNEWHVVTSWDGRHKRRRSAETSIACRDGVGSKDWDVLRQVAAFLHAAPF